MNRLHSGYGFVRHHWGAGFIMVLLACLDGLTVVYSAMSGVDAWKDPIFHLSIYR